MMKAAFLTYVQADQKRIRRTEKQHTFAVAQTAKEGRELNEAALVNAR
jgi:hypothetical protein